MHTRTCAPTHARTGSALHGLIQLGYGIRAECPHVVAEGLAYLHHSYLPFPAPPECGSGDLEPLAALETVRTDGVCACVFCDPLVSLLLERVV